MDELRVAADLRAMDKVRAFLKKTLRGVEMTEEDGFKIELSLHEICINIALYAYPGGKGEIVLRTWLDGETAWFEFRDTGIAFDPRPARPPGHRGEAQDGRPGRVRDLPLPDPDGRLRVPAGGRAERPPGLQKDPAGRESPLSIGRSLRRSPG